MSKSRQYPHDVLVHGNPNLLSAPKFVFLVSSGALIAFYRELEGSPAQLHLVLLISGSKNII